ncbi:hypothetical protein AB0F77_34025 [Streptomyces sp. NPDC026672]|uniref:hypothetical protein n=1 Tax=unclassified Streptomyces TaxID=2593676 RepID=UPI0033DD8C91
MANSFEGWMPHWVEQLPQLEVVAIPDTEKDEFVYHLFEHMRQAYDHGYSGQTRMDLGFGRVDEWKLNTSDGRELPRLWVVNRADVLMLSLAGQGMQRQEDIAVWREGIEAAIACIGTRGEEQWIAILSQDQPDPYTLNGQRLVESASTGELSFSLLTDGIAEDARIPASGLGVSVGEFFHWPIKVRGSTSCYAWRRDGEVAALARLRRISALLSLAWESPWLVREGPRNPDVSFAGASSPLQGHSWRLIADAIMRESGRTISVPNWLADAERVMSKIPRSANALLMHQEGLMLRRDHPSMALVCFTAAVETLAQISKNPETCPECSMVLSSRKRYEDAIRGVLDEEQAAYLMKAYPQRSRTVHQGGLHGTEMQIGSFGRMSLFMPDEELVFTAGTVHSAQEASKRLLLNAFGV